MALAARNILIVMKYVSIFVLIFLFGSCNNRDKIEKEIEKIPINVEIKRFDKAFSEATPAKLAELKNEFPLFFPKQFPDSVWVAKMNDTLQIELETEVLRAFPNDGKLEDVLEPLFQHIKYYFPTFETPLVVAATSDVDYQNKVILADSMLVIGLDNYLGSDHRFYEGIDKYVAKEMNASQIGPDVAEVYGRKYVSPPKERSLLGQMIYYGKKLYLADLWLPDTPDSEKIGYTPNEFTWAQENEIYMWRYFVEKELLYSTDPKLGSRFINPAPFSKFYLEIDNESPGMVGRYLGWQIVKSYMENNNTSVQELMITDADEIFKNSKYKPKK